MNIKHMNTGQCIWCRRKFPEVTFNSAPHILPKALGGLDIGCDVCDECNHYFGTATKGKPNIDLTFKEIFGAFRFFCQDLKVNSHRKFSSVFFDYFYSRQTIRIKPNFNSSILTLQFKKALYNVFLQKYHHVTGNGNHPMFDMVRAFTRYDIGQPHVCYAFNNVILAPVDKTNPSLLINDTIIDRMMESGIFDFSLFGHSFFLEVLPIAYHKNGFGYLQRQANTLLIPAAGNESIFEFSDIMQIDFLMQRFNRNK